MATKTEEKQKADRLLQLYIAEYQALTTRATYWSVLQFGMAAVAIPYIALGTNLWLNHSVYLWVFFAGLQLIGNLWCQTLLEMYDLVNYIECYLRPLVGEIVGDDRFFGWEPFLINNRYAQSHFVWVSVPFFLAAIILYLLLAYWRSFDGLVWWDLAGFIFNAILTAIFAFMIRKAWRIKSKWGEYDDHLAKKFDEIGINPSESETK